MPALKSALNRIPIWGKDIVDNFPDNWHEISDIVNKLAIDGYIKDNIYSKKVGKVLSMLGIKVRKKRNRYYAEKIPEFELQYDLI